MFGTTKHKHTTKTLTKPFYKLSKVKKKKKIPYNKTVYKALINYSITKGNKNQHYHAEREREGEKHVKEAHGIGDIVADLKV